MRGKQVTASESAESCGVPDAERLLESFLRLLQ